MKFPLIKKKIKTHRCQICRISLFCPASNCLGKVALAKTLLAQEIRPELSWVMTLPATSWALVVGAWCIIGIIHGMGHLVWSDGCNRPYYLESWRHNATSAPTSTAERQKVLKTRRGFLELTALGQNMLFLKNNANRKAGVTLLGEKKQGLQDAFHQNILRPPNHEMFMELIQNIPKHQWRTCILRCPHQYHESGTAHMSILSSQTTQASAPHCTALSFQAAATDNISTLQHWDAAPSCLASMELHFFPSGSNKTYDSAMTRTLWDIWATHPSKLWDKWGCEVTKQQSEGWTDCSSLLSAHMWFHVIFIWMKHMRSMLSISNIAN